MRPDNRYAHRSLAQLVMAKAVLVVVCRRCKHQTVLYPLNFIPRFGKDYLAINLRPHLRCTACRGIGTAHIHEAVR